VVLDVAEYHRLHIALEQIRLVGRYFFLLFFPLKFTLHRQMKPILDHSASHNDSRSNQIHLAVSGVAQWLGRRSLASGLSPTCAWSVVYRWPLCGKLPTMGQPTRPSLPSLQGIYMDYRDGRPSNGRPGWLQVKVRVHRHGLELRLFACSICDTAPLQ